MADDNVEVAVSADAGLARIKHELEKDAQLELQEIEDQVQKEKKTILENAKREAESIKQRLIAEAKKKAETRKKQELSRVRQQANMEFLGTQESLINSALEEAKAALASYANTKKYAETLKKLIVESGVALNGGDLEAVIRSQDKTIVSSQVLKELAGEIAKQVGTETSLVVAKDELSSIGGVIVREKSGTIEADNTFESRLERRMDDIRVEVSRLLVQE